MAYHKVREAQAAIVIGLNHIDGDKNPADIMSKIWGYQQVWPHLQAILFLHGETKEIKSILFSHDQIQIHQMGLHSYTNQN